METRLPPCLKHGLAAHLATHSIILWAMISHNEVPWSYPRNTAASFPLNTKEWEIVRFFLYFWIAITGLTFDSPASNYFCHPFNSPFTKLMAGFPGSNRKLPIQHIFLLSTRRHFLIHIHTFMYTTHISTAGKVTGTGAGSLVFFEYKSTKLFNVKLVLAT